MSRKTTDGDWPELESLLAGTHLHEPPDGVLRRAIALRGQLPKRQGAVEWALSLVFDSAAQPVPAGVRGAAVAERRLVYEASHADDAEGGRQVDVRLRRERAGTVVLTGQCLPAFIGSEIEVRSGRTIRHVQPGQAGEFLVRGLPATAPLRIAVRGGGLPDLVLPEVPLPRADGEDPAPES